MGSDIDLYMQATLLWDNGEFITTHIDGEQRSLYRYEGQLYVIWYTSANILDRIEIVDTETAKKMFKKFSG
jgi:hypothetical protein